MITTQCPYCDRSFDPIYLEKEHIVPQSKGGSDNEENLIEACRECNGIKSDWNVVAVIGENSTREERIKTIRCFIEWEKNQGIKRSDHPYMQGYS